jgi:uncharacterized membrane protein
MSDQTAGGAGTAVSPDQGKTANIIYILYLASIIVGITAIIGVIMAYVNRGSGPEWVESHYRFQIRTFWIGLLIGVIGFLTILIIIGWLIILFYLIWLIVRCVKGMSYISKAQAHPDPATWLW